RRKADRKVTTGSKLDLILDVTRRLMSITDLDALLRDMAQATTTLLDADRATIFIVDREKNELWSRVALGTGVGEIRLAMGVGVENAQLLAGQKRLWETLIETLAVTIDARDQQTAGHSQRVTRYAEVIGRAMGLAGIELEKLRAAALLHDYGKIAVRDEFLTK